MKYYFTSFVFSIFLQTCIANISIKVCDICVCSENKAPDLRLQILCKYSSVDWERIEWPENKRNLPIELHVSGIDSGTNMLLRFPINEQIKFVNITRSGIRTIIPGAFKNFPNLEYLSLSNNSLKHLSGNLFQGLKKLKSLDISRNNLIEITSDVFKDLENLEELHLGNNELAKVPVEVLSNLKNLKTLDLSSNLIFILKLQEVKLQSLKNLNLSRNNLTVIAAETFEELKKLENLNLSRNKIVKVEYKAFENENLKILDISYNRLSHLIKLPSNIEEINLEWNYYNFWPFDVSFKELQYLNLRENNIRKVHLDETYNKLETLLLFGNVLTEFPPVKLSKLSTLDLGNNDFVTLPKLDENLLPNLRHLSLSANPILSLQFETMPPLELLEINDMPRLNKISGLNNIRGRKVVDLLNEPCFDLSISNCERLTTLQDDVFENTNLCSLNLSYNGLQKVPHSVPRDVELDLQGNPLLCNCGLQWVLDEILPNLYESHQQVLPELRCDNTRLVYWYNWKGKALCDGNSNVKTANLRDLSRASGLEPHGILRSGRAFYAIAGTSLAVLICLVALGMYHTRAQRRKLNALKRNRRLL